MATGAGDISLPDVSKLNDLKDDQIEALIEKLAEVQAHAPQIIAALEAQQESRSRGSKSKGSKGDRKGSSDRGERTQPPKQRSPQGPQQVQENVEEEEDDEDYDDFDEDAEYPMVGDGYSDELSVVSDMTTPTVVSGMEINDEEYYRDMPGMKVNAPKKRDLLRQVAKTNARKAPGAAMSKKKAVVVADTALKKPARAASMDFTRPEKAAGAVKSGETKKKKSKDGSSTPSGTKKVKKKMVKKKVTSPNNSGSGWDDANGGGPSTGTKKKGPQEKAAPVMIDDDGFLVDQSTFETFDSSNNFFARAPSFTADASSADDTFGAFATFGGTEPAPKKTSKSKKLNVASTGKKKSSSSSSQTGGSSLKSKRKGTRRQSLGM